MNKISDDMMCSSEKTLNDLYNKNNQRQFVTMMSMPGELKTQKRANLEMLYFDTLLSKRKTCDRNIIQFRGIEQPGQFAPNAPLCAAKHKLFMHLSKEKKEISPL